MKILVTGMFGAGLEKFADSSGGAFFQGREHVIRVSVRARGASVRHRQVVTIPRDDRQ